MSALFSSWQKRVLFAGAMVIVVLAFLLFFIPSPHRTTEEMHTTISAKGGDTIDNVVEEGGSAHVVFGPVYTSLTTESEQHAVMIIATEDAGGVLRHQLVVAHVTEDEKASRAMYVFDAGVVPRSLSVPVLGIIEVHTELPDGRDEVLQFVYHEGTLERHDEHE